MAALDDLLDRYVDAGMLAAGFRRSGRRYELDGDNTILVEFTQKQLPAAVSFFVEWSVIPRASRDFHHEVLGLDPAEPEVLWGIVAGRVRVPEDRPHLFAAVSNWWSLPSPGGIEEGGTVLRTVLSTRFIPWWTGLTGADRLLGAYERNEFNFELNLGIVHTTPAAWPARYVAVHIDDGDIHQLRAMVAKVVDSGRDPDWVEWWTRRLDRREGR